MSLAACITSNSIKNSGSGLRPYIRSNGKTERLPFHFYCRAPVQAQPPAVRPQVPQGGAVQLQRLRRHGRCVCGPRHTRQRHRHRIGSDSITQSISHSFAGSINNAKMSTGKLGPYYHMLGSPSILYPARDSHPYPQWASTEEWPPVPSCPSWIWPSPALGCASPQRQLSMGPDMPRDPG